MPSQATDGPSRGSMHRTQLAPRGFNLLEELFHGHPAEKKAMEAATGGGNIFNKTMQIKSPLLQRWLDITSGTPVWHQRPVGSSHAISPSTGWLRLHEYYALAQLRQLLARVIYVMRGAEFSLLATTPMPCHADMLRCVAGPVAPRRPAGHLGRHSSLTFPDASLDTPSLVPSCCQSPHRLDLPKSTMP
ncbi:hypothetical protein HaLaN_20294 [Haematococcus lacustris]|uniref:Uncharacterized protein n=1 Tax=Haematococcus lacustris TaxID=44745 RepID=A0A699ZKI7_HAELA|nr:hypothetical protein HaLaN_20294 [Haematococcus lacustris]